jgi:hypothetical protein
MLTERKAVVDTPECMQKSSMDLRVLRLALR